MSHVRSSSREAGSALVLALLVAFILSLLGLSFIWMAETENRIAENERRGAQVLYAAETGLHVVKRWFDEPGISLHYPPVALWTRTQRRLVDETAPDGPGSPADGGSRPYYKQDVDLDGDGSDDLLHAPYRGDLRHKLMGTVEGPDLVIDAAEGSNQSDFLDELSQTLFGPIANQRGALQLRLRRIEIGAPPYLPAGAGYGRFGMGTVRVTASLYRDRLGRREVIAERSVRGVLSEVPYAGPWGPLHSCAGLVLTGSPLSVRWGAITAVGDIDLGDPTSLPLSLPRAIPGTPRTDTLLPPGAADFESLTSGLYATSAAIPDPWVRVLSAGRIIGAPAGSTQPYPSAPSPTGFDHSNLIHEWSPVNCPRLDYAAWKAVASSGGRDVRYFRYAGGTSFRENGTGATQSFAAWTAQAEGVMFFDTLDARAPRDDNGDGQFDNLTPDVILSGGTAWAPRGVIYINARRFQADEVVGEPMPLRPPGEPWLDLSDNGSCDAGEPWVNLLYPALASASPLADESDAWAGGAPRRDARGPATTDEPVALRGVLYTSGTFEGTGGATFYGSVIAESGVVQASPGGGLPTPRIFWDATLVDGWPPSGLGLPRVFYTSWDTGP